MNKRLLIVVLTGACSVGLIIGQQVRTRRITLDVVDTNAVPMLPGPPPLPPPMLRVSRPGNDTLFLHCDPSYTVTPVRASDLTPEAWRDYYYTNRAAITLLVVEPMVK